MFQLFGATKSPAFLINWTERANRIFGEVQETFISLSVSFPNRNRYKEYVVACTPKPCLSGFWKPFYFPCSIALSFEKLQRKDLDVTYPKDRFSFQVHSSSSFPQQWCCHRVGNAPKPFSCYSTGSGSRPMSSTWADPTTRPGEHLLWQTMQAPCPRHGYMAVTPDVCCTAGDQTGLCSYDTHSVLHEHK